MSAYELYAVPEGLAEPGNESLIPLELALAAEERQDAALLDDRCRARLLERLRARLPALAPVEHADPPELSDGTVVIEFWPHYVLAVVPLERREAGPAAIERALEAIEVMARTTALAVYDPRLCRRIDPERDRAQVLAMYAAAAD